jgi:hypothetical protein
MYKNISDFNNVSDYLPLFNGVLITDLIVILLLNLSFIQSKVLKKWYNDYNLSAVIADVLIILIGLIITRKIYFSIFKEFDLIKFIILSVIVQITHDILFYLFFSFVPKGSNRMLDTFKEYANEASYKAIIADSCMMISSCLISTYLVNQNLNINIIITIIAMYLLPYFIYN